MKKLLLSLLCIIGFGISFGYCVDYMTFDGSHGTSTTQSVSSGNCVRFQTSSCANSTRFEDVNGNILVSSFPEGSTKMNCFFVDGNLISSSNCQIHIFNFSSFYSEFLGISGSNNTGSCDVMTSNECQSNYDLIPISDVDQEYCLGNSLCPEIENGSGDCENEIGDVQWSALYINDIQHLGKPLINIDIPDYIFWDYSTDDEEFNLYVGSGYDQEYIDNVIAINSYRPDSQDFTDVFIGGLTLIFPYIVIVLFIVFVRKLIKRIFK